MGPSFGLVVKAEATRKLAESGDAIVAAERIR
jgi:hypothetical protein